MSCHIRDIGASMAASVVEILPGSTDDFFVALLGKVRICDDWRREDENWRRLVAVSRKKGLTFVARCSGTAFPSHSPPSDPPLEILTFHTASLIHTVQSSDRKYSTAHPN